MQILTVAVIVVGLLCVFNLILADAMIRRLRELSARVAAGPAEEVVLLPVGSTVGEVPAEAGALKQGSKIVVLMSTTCTACLAALDATARYARALPGGAADILVAVQGEGGHLDEITAVLAEPTTLVTAESADAVVAALRGRAFPSFYLLEDGLVRAAGHSPKALPDSPTARPAMVGAGSAAASDR